MCHLCDALSFVVDESGIQWLQGPCLHSLNTFYFELERDVVQLRWAVLLYRRIWAGVCVCVCVAV